jgi:hypothetical protein
MASLKRLQSLLELRLLVERVGHGADEALAIGQPSGQRGRRSGVHTGPSAERSGADQGRKNTPVIPDFLLEQGDVLGEGEGILTAGDSLATGIDQCELLRSVGSPCCR